MNSTPPGSSPAAPERQPRTRGLRQWIMLSALIVAGGYLIYSLVFQGWAYVALKTSAKAAPAQLRNASWRDPALACADSPRIGAQFDRLFERGYEAFVTRMLWDTLPPRYELFVTGMASPQRGFELRHLVMTVDLESGDRAVLRDAVVAGENGRLETARQWLAAVCNK